MPDAPSAADNIGAGAEVGLELDPERIALVQARRRRRLQVVQIPLLRLIGFVLLTFGIAFHNRVFLGFVSWPDMLEFGIVAGVYCLVSWLALVLFSASVRRFDLGDLFLTLDIALYMVAIYYAGGDRSWVFFIPLVRVADQVVTSVRRTLVFGHLITAAYLLLAAYMAFVEHRPISWSTELAKALFLYLTALYISTAARPSDRRRRRAAAAVRTARQLITRLKDQSHQLDAARAQAEEASTAKSVFLATMSHEFRTPMTIVLGMAQLLDRTELSDQQRKFLASLQKGAQSLLQILNDILDFSALDVNRLTINELEFDLREMVADGLEPLADRARGKGVEFRVETDHRLPARVVGDPARLQQILKLLVDNAVKFTSQGQIVVKIAPAGDPEAPLRVRFDVSDTGIGFPIEELDHLFGPFVQADGSAARRYGGSGIGLAIVKALVEVMGGRIKAVSTPEEGSTFTVELPLGTAPGSNPTRLEQAASE